MNATIQGRALCPTFGPAGMNNFEGDKNDLKAIEASTGFYETCTNPRVASASVMLCATVKAVTVYKTARAIGENHQRQNKKKMVNSEYVFDPRQRDNHPQRGASMAWHSTRTTVGRVNQSGRFLTVQRLHPDEDIGDRCLKPTKSIRFPARLPFTLIKRRSMTESPKSRTEGSVTLLTPSENFNMIGSGMPALSGVRQMTS